jgi:hypothetical protein
VQLYEEPTLRKKFGADYEEYCRNADRWYTIAPEFGEAFSRVAAGEDPAGGNRRGGIVSWILRRRA